MNGNDTYGATPLKLQDFDGIESFTGIITDVTSKNFDNGPRWVVTVDEDWSLVLNNTNYRAVKKRYGTESAEWIGKPMTAYKGILHSRDGEKEGICVRVPEEAAPQAALPLEAETAQPQPKGKSDDLEDDTPF